MEITKQEEVINAPVNEEKVQEEKATEPVTSVPAGESFLDRYKNVLIVLTIVFAMYCGYSLFRSTLQDVSQQAYSAGYTAGSNTVTQQYESRSTWQKIKDIF